MAGCKVKGCDGKHRSKGYCSRHYQQVLKHDKVINAIKGKHMTDFPDIEEDEPAVVVVVKPRRLHLTPAQLVMSGSDVFWRWNRENPIGWPRAEKSRLKVGK